ncbi:MAG: gamma-glutamyltransferase [Saprospiraceae bacterium]|nr:gamma-glutamyltransferase [Saprospiraceae bacterium]
MVVLLCSVSTLLVAQQNKEDLLSGPGDRYAAPSFAKRSSVIAPHAMAATSHPLSTQVALDIMQEGGNAIDAAIAANAAIGFLEPNSNGMGGDLFALIWSAKDQKLFGLNASGRAPSQVTLDRVIEDLGSVPEIPRVSPYSVTVPGAVDGWIKLHKKFGSIDMSDILAPAIRYARDGAPVPQFIAASWSGAERSQLKGQPGFADVFLPGGKAPEEGEVFKNTALARTLEQIALRGRAGFYEGEVAAEIERYCLEAGCFITKADLAAQHAVWVEPVGVDYGDFTLWELPPNGQGIAALQMLQILKPFDLASMGHNSAAYLHHLIEAKKIAFEDRGRYYADPRFAEVPVNQLISEHYISKRRKLLNVDQASQSFDPGDPRAGRGETIYLTVADSLGNMVSLIQSNYSGFGSGFTPARLGFCFQNRGCGFSLEPSHPNAYAPGKRPFHTIIPGFITKKDKPYMSYGVMGGNMQPQGHIQVFLNHIVFGMDIQSAGDVARFRHQGSTPPGGQVRQMMDGGCISLESGVSEEVRLQLKAMGHKLCNNRWTHYGGYQGILWNEEQEVYWGATESRSDGQAAGW